MFGNLGKGIYNYTLTFNPWTNVYGFSRSLLALATALTLVFNDINLLFKPSAGREYFPLCNNNISFFCIGPNDYFTLSVLKWIAIICLLVVASGWRPKFTGIIHWWISYSMNISATTIDGGEQVAAVITFLLIPITLTDRRKWHWQSMEKEDTANSDKLIYSKIIALVSYNAIRVQVAIIYFHATVAKLFEETWLNGTAVYYYLNDPMLGLNPFLLTFINPILSSPLVVVATWGTLILQTLLFTALFSSKKYWRSFLIIALLLHEVIAVMFGLISFSLVMIGALVLYLRPLEDKFRFYQLLEVKVRRKFKGFTLNLEKG
ncbi:hypothetical protein GMD78_18490 [Ornithinibacillus sp. L9]|uniref:HTTM-like domain-containing protein n=1 Tax=Ornithinibacillus caprae TaxID=2678566 RepID=A0A6N8FNH6_9BACI|nr:sporulation-delaying protein SdpB family protein [Ornithinibacillus caprae]MUK90366.1 hypothetical protein [Ornithinibacillus caprae]